jgi:hypothetical protein
LLALGIIDEVIQENDTAVRRAISRALDEARVGDRIKRLDEATARWIK